MYWPATLACTAFLSVYWPPTLACTCYLSNVLGGTTRNRKFEVNIRVGRYNILLVWGHFDFAKSPSKSFFDTMSDLTLFPLALFLYLSLSSPLKSHTFSTFSNTLFALFPQEIFSPKKYFFFSKILFMFTSSIVSFPPLINSHISPFILDQILPLFLSFFIAHWSHPAGLLSFSVCQSPVFKALVDCVCMCVCVLVFSEQIFKAENP